MAWDLKTIFIAFFVGGLMLFSLVNFMYDLDAEYGVEVSSDYNTTYSRISEALISNATKETQTLSKSVGKEDITLVTAIGFVTDTAVAAIRLPFRIIGTIPEILTLTLDKIGAPEGIIEQVPIVIYSIVVVVVAFLVLSAIFKKENL